jgi:hypothetical protein
VFKKTKKPIKSRKLKKPNRKKKPIKILKKPTGSVRFRFFKPGTGKTEPNRKKTGKKPSQTEKTEPNRFEPIFSLKNQTEPNRNRSV